VVRLDYLGDLVVELLEVEVAFVGDWYAVADDVNGLFERVLGASHVEAIT
jgi:hypothetical protein